jgi:hypothetical protein
MLRLDVKAAGNDGVALVTDRDGRELSIGGRCPVRYEQSASHRERMAEDHSVLSVEGPLHRPIVITCAGLAGQ